MLEELKQFATPIEIECINAVIKYGSNNKASIALGKSRRSIDKAITRVKRRAALQGYSPQHDMTRIVPAPFIVRGISTYYNKDGKPSAQWVKTRVDEDKLAIARQAALDAIIEEIKPCSPVPKSGNYYDDLCNLYTLTDCHVGMLAWHKEGGADWDISIAEKTLTQAFAHMVDSAPRAKVGFINQLGDFLHSDGMLPVTPTSGHILDQDSRYSKIVSTVIRIIRQLITMALNKHEKVIVLLAEGNHDISSSIWLRAMFSALYENEPRVQIISSETPYYAYEHGETMLAFHHGHLTKVDNLPLLFATKFPKIWGNTNKRYGHTGHMHHKYIKEHSGMTMTQHATITAADAHSSRHGYMSDREVRAITYHSKYGEVAINVVIPEMLAL